MVTRYAVIEGSKVKNLALADAVYASEQGWIEVPPQVDIGWAYNGGVFTPPAPDLIALAESARKDRNELLATSDWTQVADAPVDQVAWATYRQALRDVTAQVGFPEIINWPMAP